MKAYFEKNNSSTFFEKLFNNQWSLILIAISFIFLVLSHLNKDSKDSSNYLAADVIDLVETTSQDFTTIMNDLYVDIKGAIKKPGVYQLQKGSRLIDLIEKAGGFEEDAEQNSLNLALLLEDQMMIHVYTKADWQSLTSDDQEGKSQKFTAIVSDSASLKEENENERQININTANQTELETLPQIGPAKAQRIIQHRQDFGSFSSCEELLEVSGIGPKTFEGLKDFITVGP